MPKSSNTAASFALHGFAPYKEKKGEEYMNDKQKGAF